MSARGQLKRCPNGMRIMASNYVCLDTSDVYLHGAVAFLPFVTGAAVDSCYLLEARLAGTTMRFSASCSCVASIRLRGCGSGKMNNRSGVYSDSPD